MTTATVVVDRTSLSLAALDISASPYRLGGPDQALEFGAVSWRKEWAKSPYMSGGILTGAVRDVAQGGHVEVDVVGADQAAVRNNVGVLLAAFAQFTYTLTVTLDGNAWAWACAPADYTVGVTGDSNMFGTLCRVGLSFERSPIPVAGPY